MQNNLIHHKMLIVYGPTMKLINSINDDNILINHYKKKHSNSIKKTKIFFYRKVTKRVWIDPFVFCND